jgi:hypothetical protein
MEDMVWMSSSRLPGPCVGHEEFLGAGVDAVEFDALEFGLALEGAFGGEEDVLTADAERGNGDGDEAQEGEEASVDGEGGFTGGNGVVHGGDDADVGCFFGAGAAAVLEEGEEAFLDGVGEGA